MAIDYSLNTRMEFDSVIRVTESGAIEDVPGVYAPELMDEEILSNKWEFFSTGYTGQYSYNGPIMHNSEFIGGRLEHDILTTPGVYVAVVANWTSDTGEDYDSEGWAILKLKEN